jgi:hypothetical protein
MNLTENNNERRLSEDTVNTSVVGFGCSDGAALFRRPSRTALDVLLLAALVVNVSPLTTRAEDGSNSAPSPVEQFKNFISSPPIIQNLVFQQKVPMESGARPLDGTFALSTRFDYYHGKWQPDGMLFRRLNRPEDATNFTFAGNLVSVSAHQHALVEPGGRLTTWDDRDPSVAGKTISVFYTTQLALDPLREILNLGIMRAGIGTIRWVGDQFRTECEVDHKRVLITGELVPSRDAPPSGMRVCYMFPNMTNRYVLRYGYAPGLKYSFLPAAITNFWVTQSRRGVEKEIELDEWRILALDIAEAPLLAESFNPAPFTGQGEWTTRVYTNGALYTRLTNGMLQFPVSLETPKRPFLPRLRASPRVVYTCWAGLNIAIFALMLRAKHTETKQEQKGCIYEI